MTTRLRDRHAVGTWGVMTAALTVVLTVLTGCADRNWTKPGMTSQQLDLDKGRCTREFLTPGAGGAVRNYAVDAECMRNLGYTRE